MVTEPNELIAALGLRIGVRQIDWEVPRAASAQGGPDDPVNEQRRALVAEWDHEWCAASWAVVGGGFAVSRRYVCAEVRNADLPLGVLPRDVVGRFLEGLALTDAVVTLTSANVAAYASGAARDGDASAVVLVTAGLANALRVGEPSNGPPRRYLPDTINLVCWLDAPLTVAAQLEAHSIMSQARTLAVLEARVPTLDQNGWATGTGTDCLTLFTPNAPDRQADYAGMHTSIGRVLGQAVRQATAKVVAAWQADAKRRTHQVAAK